MRPLYPVRPPRPCQRVVRRQHLKLPARLRIPQDLGNVRHFVAVQRRVEVSLLSGLYRLLCCGASFCLFAQLKVLQQAVEHGLRLHRRVDLQRVLLVAGQLHPVAVSLGVPLREQL